MVPGSSAVEQPAVNRLVAGSNPAGEPNKIKDLASPAKPNIPAWATTGLTLGLSRRAHRPCQGRCPNRMWRSSAASITGLGSPLRPRVAPGNRAPRPATAAQLKPLAGASPLQPLNRQNGRPMLGCGGQTAWSQGAFSRESSLRGELMWAALIRSIAVFSVHRNVGRKSSRCSGRCCFSLSPHYCLTHVCI